MEGNGYPEKWWHCYVKLKGKTRPDGIANDMAFSDVVEKIATPWRRNRPFTVQGVIVRDPEQVETIRIVHTNLPQEQYAELHNHEMRSKGITDLATNRRMLPFRHDNGTDHTYDLLFREAKPPVETSTSVNISWEGPDPPLKAFLVHGHDRALLHEVARFIERLGVEPVILMEQPHQGRTLIEKFEQNADVRYAVVLCTYDDDGAARDGEPAPRPRQNVVLELGYFIGSLGRNRVCVLMDPGVEMPSDLHGVGYHPIDDAGAWKQRLAQEMKAAGLRVNPNALIAH